MGTRDPHIDTYIVKAAPFVQPILMRLRDTVHRGAPEVEENENGVKVERARPTKRRVTVPHVLQRALKQNRAARTSFESFNPGHRRPRNWKYMKQ